MGRKKLTIKRLETAKDRQIKYSKRKNGILKKAEELSVLCDVDVALVMFSPTGKPSVYVGRNKDLLDVVDRLSNIFVADREKRRGYTVKLLKKLYADGDVDLRNYTLDKNDFLKLQQNHLAELKGKIAEKKRILGEWTNPESIMDLHQIEIMEKHLALSIENIKAKKRELIIENQEPEQISVHTFQGEPIIWQQQIGQAS